MADDAVNTILKGAVVTAGFLATLYWMVSRNSSDNINLEVPQATSVAPVPPVTSASQFTPCTQFTPVPLFTPLSPVSPVPVTPSLLTFPPVPVNVPGRVLFPMEGMRLVRYYVCEVDIDGEPWYIITNSPTCVNDTSRSSTSELPPQPQPTTDAGVKWPCRVEEPCPGRPRRKRWYEVDDD